jgi:L-fuconolactonase
MLQPIIDTHIHIWDLQKAAYPWLDGDESILRHNYDLSQLEPERQQTNVVGGVLVQAAGNKEDTDLMMEAASKYDWIKGVVVWLPLTDPEAVSKLLKDHYLDNPYFKGVRHQVHDEKDAAWLLQPEVMRSLQILADYEIPYDVVGILPAHIETVLQVAREIPALKMVFDHLNQPPVATRQQFGLWGELMLQAAAFPNLYAKISGLGTTSGKPHRWQADDIRPYVDFVLRAFGADRCFCGGDWPVSLLAGSYVHAWEVYETTINSLLNKEDSAKVLHDNALQFYKL